MEDGRTDAPAAGAAQQFAPADGGAQGPLVLAPEAVLVTFDGGPAGRAALEHAIRVLPGTLAIVHFWTAVDPLRAARVGGQPGAGAQLLHAVYADNERARAEAQRVAAAAVAIAQEAGRDAVALVQREDDGVVREAHLRALVGRHGAGHLVIAASPRSWWRRVLLGPGTAEGLAADPPCTCTVLPADAG